MKPAQFAKALAEMQAQIVELHIRLANTVRHGKCTDVDPEKHLCRMSIGKDPQTGEVQKSPWMRYGQHAGALKVHIVPTVGQNMTAFSPGGDFEQGMAMSLQWNDDNPSPSTKGDEVVASYLSKVKLTVQDGKLIVDVPDTTLRADDDHMVHLTKDDGLKVKGDALFVKGQVMHAPDEQSPPKKIDSSHVHGGVEPGGGTTAPPE